MDVKMRRYLAADVRSALRQAREQQGPEVLIVSNRKVEGGVELITAEDFDERDWDSSPAQVPSAPTPLARAEAVAGSEAVAPARPAPVARTLESLAASSPLARTPESLAAARPPARESEALGEQMREELRQLRGLVQRQLPGLAWGDFGHRHPIWAAVLRRLIEIDVEPQLARQLLQKVPETADVEQAWQRALAALAQRLPVAEGDVTARGGLIALVGPTGVGKTTLVAKLAARAVLEHGPEQLGLISLDRRRIGAFEQLRGFGRLLGVPVWTVGSEQELRRAVDSARGRRLVLLDTAGAGPRSAHLEEQVGLLARGAPEARSFVVLAAPTLAFGLGALLASYAPARPAGCVLTKLDEAASLGAVLSAAIAHALPVAFVSDGQRIPDDLHLPQAHRLVAQAVRLGREAGKRCEEALLEHAMSEEDFRAYA